MGFILDFLFGLGKSLNEVVFINKVDKEMIKLSNAIKM